jgi:arginase
MPTISNSRSERLKLTAYLGRAGDRNSRAMAGAALVGEALSERLDLPLALIGAPAPPLGLSWERELDASRAELKALATRVDQIFRDEHVPITAFGRCACALATLPVVVRHRPDVKIVWFDAHADANTPDTSTTGYLGGVILTGAAGLWHTGLGDGLKLSEVVLVGCRDLDPAESALIDDGTFKLIRPGTDIAECLRTAVGRSPVYVHVDCDVLDPDVVPTEYRVDGGLSLGDLRAASGVLAEHEVVGLEIAEFEATWTDGRRGSPQPILEGLEPILSSLSRR